MAIVRWEPFRDPVSAQDQFNRLVNETFSRYFSGAEAGDARSDGDADEVRRGDSALLS